MNFCHPLINLIDRPTRKKSKQKLFIEMVNNVYYSFLSLSERWNLGYPV